AHDTIEGAVSELSIPALDAEEFERAMEALTSDERDAVRLIVCQGMSYEDAARSLGVNISTINNWKYRGLQKLKHNATRVNGGGTTARVPGATRTLHGRGDVDEGTSARPTARGNRLGYEHDGARRLHRKVCSI